MDFLFARSGRLFARPSFIEGFTRVIDLGNTLNEYNTNKTELEADLSSIKSDWSAVGEQLEFALEDFSNQDVS